MPVANYWVCRWNSNSATEQIIGKIAKVYSKIIKSSCVLFMKLGSLAHKLFGHQSNV